MAGIQDKGKVKKIFKKGNVVLYIDGYDGEFLVYDIAGNIPKQIYSGYDFTKAKNSFCNSIDTLNSHLCQSETMDVGGGTLKCDSCFLRG